MSYGAQPLDIRDDVLMRILDEQASDDEHAALESLGHLASARLWALREASERFREAVAAVPIPALPPMPTVSVRRRTLEAKAAIIALLLVAGAAVAMPSTRALATDAARKVVSWITGATADPAEPDVEPGGATVRFAPNGAVFAVTIESSQQGGSVVFVRSQGGEIIAQAMSDAELVVLPGELLIRNRAQSGEDIVVSVPASVTDLRLRVGGVSRVVSFGAEQRVVIPMR